MIADMQVKRNGLVTARKTKAIPRRAVARRWLPASSYVFPTERAYPIPDAHHAGLALQALLRVAGRHGVDAGSRRRAARVLAVVRRRFPGIYEGERNLVTEVRSRYRLQTQSYGPQSVVDRMVDKYGK